MDRIDEAVEVALSKMPVDVWNADGADYVRAALLAGVKVLLGEPVGYVAPSELIDLARHGGAISMGTNSQRYGRTKPVYAPSLGEGDGR